MQTLFHPSLVSKWSCQTSLTSESSRLRSLACIFNSVNFSDPFPVENFPGGTDSHGNDLKTFFQTRAAFDKHVPKLLNAAEILREQGTKKLLVYGICWGGKIVSIAGSTSVNYGGQSIPAFDGVAVVHPAYVSLAQTCVEIPNTDW